MKCVICNSSDIVEKEVDEELKIGNNIVLIPILTKVCRSCGERYYNRETMKLLEKVEEKLEKNIMYLEVIGKVLKVPVVIK